jgi:hypothetical protein
MSSKKNNEKYKEGRALAYDRINPFPFDKEIFDIDNPSHKWLVRLFLMISLGFDIDVPLRNRTKAIKEYTDTLSPNIGLLLDMVGVK